MTAGAQRCCYIGCGKLYVPRATGGQRAAHLYCSRACHAATRAKRMDRRTCPSCGDPFFVVQSSQQQTCSVDCRGDMMSGRTSKLVRCEACHSLFDRPRECVGEQRETYGFSAIALAEGWS